MAKTETYLLYCGVERTMSIGGRRVDSLSPSENIGDRSLSWHLIDALRADTGTDALEQAAKAALPQARAWAEEHSMWAGAQFPEGAKHPRGEGAALSFTIKALLVERSTMLPAMIAYDEDYAQDLRGDLLLIHEPLFEDISSKLARLDAEAAIDDAAAPGASAKAAPRI